MDFLLETTAPFYSKVEPGVAVAVTLAASFAGIMLIRLVFEHDFYLLRWWSFRLGDSIGFPLYAYFAAQALQDYKSDGSWYDTRWFVICLSALGMVIGLCLFLDLHRIHSNENIREFLLVCFVLQLP